MVYYINDIADIRIINFIHAKYNIDKINNYIDIDDYIKDMIVFYDYESYYYKFIIDIYTLIYYNIHKSNNFNYIINEINSKKLYKINDIYTYYLISINSDIFNKFSHIKDIFIKLITINKYKLYNFIKNDLVIYHNFNISDYIDNNIYLEFYKYIGDRILNYCIRNDTMTLFIKEIHDNIYNIIDTPNNLKNDVYLYRGINKELSDILYDIPINNDILLKGFQSSSFDYEKPLNFSIDGTLLLIHYNNSNFIYFNDNEQEILTYPNSSYKITNKLYNNGILMINLEYINHSIIQYNYIDNFDKYFIAFFKKLNEYDIHYSYIFNWTELYYIILNYIDDFINIWLLLNINDIVIYNNDYISYYIKFMTNLLTNFNNIKIKKKYSYNLLHKYKIIKSNISYNHHDYNDKYNILKYFLSNDIYNNVLNYDKINIKKYMKLIYIDNIDDLIFSFIIKILYRYYFNEDL